MSWTPSVKCESVSVGDKFGSLTVIGEPFSTIRPTSEYRDVYCVCQCACGKVVAKQVYFLRKSKRCSRSCNMYAAVVKSGHPLHACYDNMRKRCLDPNNKRYKDYGGRGIGICNEWVESRSQFLEWALASGWAKGLQIDRIDNDGDYCPENCRFVTPKENMRDRRNSHKIAAFGEAKTAGEWAEDFRCRVSERTLECRIRRDWHPELAITEPNRS